MFKKFVSIAAAGALAVGIAAPSCGNGQPSRRLIRTVRAEQLPRVYGRPSKRSSERSFSVSVLPVHAVLHGLILDWY